MEEEVKKSLNEIGGDLPTSMDLNLIASDLLNDANVIINKFSKRKSLFHNIPEFISVMKNYREYLMNFNSKFK